MKILIIGASGMLAQPVIEKLNESDFELRLFSRTIENAPFSDRYESVQGDVFDTPTLKTAMQGCDAAHISISKVDEVEATRTVLAVAREMKIKLVSYVSGATVSEKNAWFPMIGNKLKAEQEIIKSGIPYIIFKPGWFFESLERFVRNNRASVIGKQIQNSRWMASEDFGRMVANAYRTPEARNMSFYTLGKDSYKMKELLTKYVEEMYPHIKKISTVPIGLLKFIATIKRNKELKHVAAMFRYFEKTKVDGDTTTAYKILGEPKLGFQKWIEKKKKNQRKIHSTTTAEKKH